MRRVMARAIYPPELAVRDALVHRLCAFGPADAVVARMQQQRGHLRERVKPVEKGGRIEPAAMQQVVALHAVAVYQRVERLAVGLRFGARQGLTASQRSLPLPPGEGKPAGQV